MTLPLLYLQPVDGDFAPSSRLLLHYRASDMSLTPMTQQAVAYTRTTAGWATDRNGQLRKCMYAQSRYTQYDTDADGVGDRTGLLLEPSRSNQWTRSAAQGNAAYTTENSTVAAATTVYGPDGRLSAFTITENSTASVAHGLLRPPATMTNSTLQAISVYARAGTRTWCYVQTISKAGTTSNSWVNLATGATGTVSGNHTLRVIAGPDGWYRITVIWNSGTGATTPAFSLRLATANNTTTYTGDGTSLIYTFGWQHEVDVPFETSYIETTTAAVTRAADSFLVTANWGVPTDLTVYFKLKRPVHLDVSGALGYTPYLCSHGVGNSRIAIYFDPATRNLVASITDGTATTQTATRALSLWTAAEVDGCVQFRTMTTAPTARIDLGTGFGTASTAVTGLAAFGSTAFAIGDNANSVGSVLASELATLKVAVGQVTLADMRERY